MSSEPLNRPAQENMAEAQQMLQGKESIRVQQFRRRRNLCACDFNNWYKVLDSQNNEVFFVKENSTCVERNCCHGDCKAWRMDVFVPGPSGDIWQNDHKPFLHLERPFSLTCCCFNRPTVFVSEGFGPGSEQHGRPLGELNDPFTCCNLKTSIKYPGEEAAQHHIVGSPCQIGMCCKCPGQKIEFPIQDSAGKEVAHMTKTWMLGDICPCLSKEWSTFDINFKEMNEGDSQLLLMSTALFVQLLWFDSRNNDKDT